jgi:hypothetical protein
MYYYSLQIEMGLKTRKIRISVARQRTLKSPTEEAVAVDTNPEGYSRSVM